ncbi:hypothetical protein SAMN04487969_102373 [Paenibacillus algorifonticola]|uniref:Uncharacterized protein n=1 Tax=Paenibacillus algorifonticola TaxID=684063 RepID=A0A1I2A9Y9_9BACL|nr:hypothetical protein [Paenibacillus algorifonticola]SFE40672.1 hypothetical protein SAMN04487969_102373 [Paenibacillus algorifonticola]
MKKSTPSANIAVGFSTSSAVLFAGIAVVGLLAVVTQTWVAFAAALSISGSGSVSRTAC